MTTQKTFRPITSGVQYQTTDGNLSGSLRLYWMTNELHGDVVQLNTDTPEIKDVVLSKGQLPCLIQPNLPKALYETRCRISGGVERIDNETWSAFVDVIGWRRLERLT